MNSKKGMGEKEFLSLFIFFPKNHLVLQIVFRNSQRFENAAAEKNDIKLADVPIQGLLKICTETP